MDISAAIQAYFEQAAANGVTPTINDFVDSNTAFIVRNTPDRENISRFWSTRFSQYALNNNIKLLNPPRSRPNWSHVQALINSNTGRDADVAGSESQPSEPPSSSSSSKGTKRSRSLSDSCPMTESMMLEFENAFNALEDSKKWRLPDGAFVENILYEKGKTMNFEHLIHSFVLNLDDQATTSLFTKEQLDHIKSAGQPPFPKLPDSVQAIFDDCARLFTDMYAKAQPETPITAIQEAELRKQLWAKMAGYGFFDPEDQFDESWLQRTIMDILVHWYQHDTLSAVAREGSETDLVVRVWSILDKVFDNIRVITKRDHTCITTAIRDHANRSVTGTASIDAEQTTIRPDLILFRNGVEYGTGEVGKHDLDGVGKKETVETNLRLPKVLKDMMVMAAARCNNKQDIIHSLQIVSYNQTHLRMSATVLDCPEGYVCRIRSTQNYQVHTSPSLMQKGVLPILKLGLKIKYMVQQNVSTLEKYSNGNSDADADFLCDQSDHNILLLPSALRTSKKRNKAA